MVEPKKSLKIKKPAQKEDQLATPAAKADVPAKPETLEKTVTPASVTPATQPAKSPQPDIVVPPKVVPVGPRTALIKDGIIPSTPGHSIIIANQNVFRHTEEHGTPAATHKAVISPDDNKVLRGN
ncbi:MAG: hypothetical protein ABR999_10830 [Methanoregula sp.]|jgi:hypothetical protein|uniref:hypothetical protein n=1 Tax=Methanoregula sp. TaxID=2052170 RepID=UPI003D15103A